MAQRNPTFVTVDRATAMGRIRRLASPVFLLPLVLALFGCILSLYQSDVAQWNLSGSDDVDPERRYVFGVTYALAVLLALTRFREAHRLLTANWHYLVLLLFMALSVLWSAFPLKVLIGLGHSIGVVAIVLTAVMAARGNPVLIFRVVALAGSVMLVLSLVTVFVVPARGIMAVGETQRWVGLSSHPNMLGLAALITAWASTAALFHAETPKARLGLWLALGLAAISMYGANSVTAGVLAAFCVVGTPILAWLFDREASQRLVLAIVMLVVLVVAAFAFNLLAPDIVASETFLRVVGRTASLTGRTELWNLAWDAIAEKPLMGWSFDGLQSLNVLGRLQVGQFHNGYLDVLVRGGWTGLALVVWLIVATALRLLRLVSLEARIWAPLAIFFAVVVLHNVTEASLAQSPGALWMLFTLLFFLLSTLGTPPETGMGRRLGRRGR